MTKLHMLILTRIWDGFVICQNQTFSCIRLTAKLYQPRRTSVAYKEIIKQISSSQNLKTYDLRNSRCNINTFFVLIQD